jgi:hypothetical protein
VASDDYSHDVFISHATEDKDRFVRPLAEALRGRGVTVWYDEWELAVGDSLVEKIDDGLGNSRFGVVVLSPAFFSKNWSRAELQAFAALEMRQSRSLLLPIWLELGPDEIATQAPLLLGRVALQAADGVDAVAEELATKVKGGRADRRLHAPPSSPKLYPSDIHRESLPHSYDPPLASDDTGFVFRTVTAFRVPLPPDAYLNSQQKRAFQAILSDSSLEGLVQGLVDRRSEWASVTWAQVQPNTGTAVTVARPPETMGIRGGSIEARGGLHLRFYTAGTAHAIVHIDLVLRPPAEMHVRSLLSLDEFYSLLSVPAASARDEIAPVVTALLTDNDEPTLIAQSVVALPNRNDFSTYLDLAVWANDRVPDATGPSAVHWNATSISEIDSSAAWRQSVIKMIDRLFSDGSFLDYEHSIRRLDGS